MPSVLGTQPQTFARGREITALLLWTFAVFLCLALASYAGDPAAVVAPVTDGPPVPPAIIGENWVGPVGAAVARAFVTLVGVAAWVVPIEALLLGIPYVRGRKTNATPARLAGDLLMVVIGAALVQVGGPGKMAFGHHPAGGMIGELFGELARSLFSTMGSFLVGFALLGLILISRAHFSFIALMKWIGRLGSVSAEKTATGARSVAGAWAKARELDREKEAQRRKDEEPLIAGPASGAATILVPEDEAGDDEVIRDSDPGEREGLIGGERASGPRVRIVSEPFPEEKSPLVILEDKKKARKKKSDDDAKALAAKAKAKAKLDLEEEEEDEEDEEESEDEESDEAEAEVETPVRAKRSRRKKTDGEEEAESVAKAVADDDAPVALDVTPLEGLDAAP
jgi:S-DNA-T family DNA segregation ATPase FtsK/SpoIIIE